MDYIDLTGPNGTEDNVGGTIDRLYYAPKSYFTTIQDTDENLSTATTFAELSEINTAHVFAAGKGFHTMYNTQDSGSIEYTRVGERDGFTMKGVAKFFYPGSKSEMLGWIRQAKNDQFIFLFPLPDGVVHQGGSTLFAALLSPEKFSTGTNGGGRRGTEFQVEWFCSGPILYKAAISLYP